MPKHSLAWDCMGCGHLGNQEETCAKCGRARGKAKLYDYLDLSETTAGHKVPLFDVLERLTTIKRPRPPPPKVSPSRPVARRPPTMPATRVPKKSSTLGWLVILLLGLAIGAVAAWQFPQGKAAILELQGWLTGSPR